MLRIIAGELRGRRIRVPRVDGLRPTGERVREALFSILGDRTEGARVLDAYAGSGALGFEALSRGARQVVFVETAAAALQGLERTAAALGVAERCRIVRGRVLDVVVQGGRETGGRVAVHGPFELIFADPPWSAGEGPPFLRWAGESGALASEGLLILERAARDPAPDPPRGALRPLRTTRYGDTALDFFAPGDPKNVAG